MKKRLSLLVFLAAGVLAGGQAATYQGVTLPDTATLGGKTLVLNGMGLREYFFFDIYVGGLYLPQKATTPAAVLAEQGPYRVVMAMKHGVSRRQFVDAWRSDLKANNKGDYSKLKPQIAQFAKLFDAAKSGDEIIMDYVPGKGVSVTHNGRLMGTVSGNNFHEALLHVYVGPHPPTETLKKGLLGAHG